MADQPKAHRVATGTATSTYSLSESKATSVAFSVSGVERLTGIEDLTRGRAQEGRAVLLQPGKVSQ
ncbi:hypothetical protein AAD16_005482 [Salmonella enterica subsp. diarizonae]|nr:hypothetical protein [Salmonella enterica subsp. diarizonae]EDY0793476.1 hypothetical protein [Salmonella enterica subsp. diarizonae]